MPGPVIKAPDIPWWADPKGASVMDPLYVSLARKATSALGLDDPQSQAMSVAGGPLTAVGEPVGGFVGLLNRRAVPTMTKRPVMGDTTRKLVDMLHNFNPSEEQTMVKAPIDPRYSGKYVPPTSRGGDLLRSMVSRNPDLKGQFETGLANKAIQRPPAFQQIATEQGAVRNSFRPTVEQKYESAISGVNKPYTAITDPGELKDIVLPANHTPVTPPPPSVRSPLHSGRLSAISRMSQNGWTDEAIRNLRQLPWQDALNLYPNIKPNTLLAIYKGDSYGHIK